jgi:Fuc2NAc and GlcNAc transferase
VRAEAVVIFLAAVAMSAMLTGLVRNLALSQGVLDIPNERSSHGTPTPRGGGVSIVLVASAALAALGLFGLLHRDLLLALVGGGVAVAIVGFLDDHRSLPASVRLAVHFGAAWWALIWLGGIPPLRIGAQTVQMGWVGSVLAVLGIVWTVNLFNFMDGIDGIAACEAVFVACAGALLTLIAGHASDVPAVSLAFSAACLGFLLWNWPPARIFMGDVGSGYLGYVIAVLGMAAAHESPTALWAWLILGGAFLVDATVTLVRRMLRGEPVHEAHRSHAYQWLARRWGSHRKVTVAVTVLNLIWLLPCAVLVTVHPDHAVAIVGVALVPIVALALAAGSGRRENGSSKAAIT